VPVGSCKLKLGVEKRDADNVAAISVTVIHEGEFTTDGACHERMSLKPAIDRRGCGRVRTEGRQFRRGRDGSQRAIPLGRGRYVRLKADTTYGN